jgi:hypothetical protein
MEKKAFQNKSKDASSYKLINEIEIINDFAKMIQKSFMPRVSYFKDVMEPIGNIIAFSSKSSLSLFLVHTIKTILNYLNINTKLAMFSSQNRNNILKRQDKILDMRKLLGASDYYNATSRQELYDRGIFLKEGINLYFLKSNLMPYLIVASSQTILYIIF